MSSKLRPSFGALCLILAISVGVLGGGSSNATDYDDHSYLPPWMLNGSGEVRKFDEKAVPPKVSRAKEPQPARADAQPVKANEPAAPDLTARATQVRTKVVGFVSNIFQKTLRFATNE